MKIFLFNAPAGAGKDLAADLCKGDLGGTMLKFAAPLKAAAAAICFNNNRAAFDAIDTDQEKKIEPREEFFGVSARQFQIDVSEKFMKPTYGIDVFGKILAKKIRDWNLIDENNDAGPFWVSDSGFEPEAAVLVKEFGAENVILIRVHREGKTYTNDSRGYINLDHLGVKSFDVYNDGTIEEFDAKLMEITNNIMGVNR